jgi:hypothetical protein
LAACGGRVAPDNQLWVAASTFAPARKSFKLAQNSDWPPSVCGFNTSCCLTGVAHKGCLTVPLFSLRQPNLCNRFFTISQNGSILCQGSPSELTARLSCRTRPAARWSSSCDIR